MQRLIRTCASVVMVIAAMVAFVTPSPVGAQTSPNERRVTILCTCNGHSWVETLRFFKRNANEDIYVQCQNPLPDTLSADEVAAVQKAIATRCPDVCGGLKRGYHQAQALLDTFDQQFQDLKNAYNADYDKLHDLVAQEQAIDVDAQNELRVVAGVKLAADVASLTTDTIVAAVAVAVGAVEDAEEVPAVSLAFDAGHEVIEFYNAWIAGHGTVEEVREFVNELDATGLYDLEALTKMLDLMDQMADVGQDMRRIQNNFRSRDVAGTRNQLLDQAKDAKDAWLAACPQAGPAVASGL